MASASVLLLPGVPIRLKSCASPVRRIERAICTRIASVRKRVVTRCCSSGSTEKEKASFGYTRKDVLIIGGGVVAFGVALKTGLEVAGLDSLKAGNAVQLVMVLGLTLGWIYSYIFRVANKDMTYVKQLKDYELKVMEKRYQELPEAELEALLAQVEEEKERLYKRKSDRTTAP